MGEQVDVYESDMEFSASVNEKDYSFFFIGDDTSLELQTKNGSLKDNINDVSELSLPFDRTGIILQVHETNIRIFVEQPEPSFMDVSFKFATKGLEKASFNFKINYNDEGKLLCHIPAETMNHQRQLQELVKGHMQLSYLSIFALLDALNNKHTKTSIETLSKGKHLRQRFGRSLVNIDRIIHIHKEGETVKSLTNGSIEFNHRFEVRGHWRKLKYDFSYGKNRQGEKKIKGYTWVVPHERGEGELIKKTRVLHD